jgi:hypothetical protein
VCVDAGDLDAAIQFCERAMDERDMLFALFQRWLPDFEPVRNDSRFAAILGRFNAQRRA